MFTQRSLTPSSPLPRSMDFGLLRERGIQYLQNLAAQSWTDHNEHDPGITVLNALCYAITDLGNRLNLPIEDILFSQPGFEETKLGEAFPEAPLVFPNCAWTEKDFRKILMDIPGLRNIHLQKARNVPPLFYLDDTSGSEAFSFPGGPNLEQVELNGLIALQPEYELTATGEDLNSRRITGQISIPPQTYDLGIYVSSSNDLSDEWFSTFPLINASIIDLIPVQNDPADPVSQFFVRLSIEIDSFPDPIELAIDIQVTQENGIPAADVPTAQTEIETLLTDLSPNSVLNSFKSRLEATVPIQENLIEKFHTNRNLCEDLVQVNRVCIQEVTIYTTVEILPGKDPNLILSRIYFALEQFLSPIVKRYTFNELYETKKRPIEEILQGPLLDKGFIEDRDLEILNPKRVVYTSDLIRLIMEVDGVFAVNDLRISNFLGTSELVTTPEFNCIQLIDRCIPKFDRTRSSITLTRSKVALALDEEEVSAQLTDLRNKALELPDNFDIDLPFPKGEQFELDRFYSIQHEFAPHYFIGDGGVPASASDERKAQARQFKGYLTIYDQLLANCAAQIANICRLFSPDATEDITYFSLPVYSIPRLDDLLLSFLSSGQTFEDFKSDLTNQYLEQLSEITEDENTFLDRRNRVLDHLLARFGEVFPDWTILKFFSLNLHYIQDKIRFFTEYHINYSNTRNKAFNCFPGSGIWDTDNVSGVQKRVAGLLGIPDFRRRLLSEEPDPGDFFEFLNGGLAFRLVEEDTVLIESDNFANIVEATENASLAIRIGINLSNYGPAGISPGDPDQIEIALLNAPDTLALIRTPVVEGEDIELTRLNAINRVRNALLQVHKDGEGFFLVEHILLRPLENETGITNSFLPLFFPDQNAQNVGQLGLTPSFLVRDPYSFRVTWILPSGFERDFSDATSELTDRIWSFRFRDEEFRRFLEKTIRLETPAHILPQIYYLHRDTSPSWESNVLANGAVAPSLNNFERLFEEWLTSKMDASATPGDRISAQDAFVDLMNTLINP